MLGVAGGRREALVPQCVLTCGTVCCAALLQLVGPSHSSAKRRTRPVEAHAARRCEATTKQLAHWHCCGMACLTLPHDCVLDGRSVAHILPRKGARSALRVQPMQVPLLLLSRRLQLQPHNSVMPAPLQQGGPQQPCTCPPSALMMKHAHTTHPRSDVLVQALLQVSGELAQD